MILSFRTDRSRQTVFVRLFDLWFYIPVNNYGHVEMVSEPNHTFASSALLESVEGREWS